MCRFPHVHLPACLVRSLRKKKTIFREVSCEIRSKCKRVPFSLNYAHSLPRGFMTRALLGPSETHTSRKKITGFGKPSEVKNGPRAILTYFFKLESYTPVHLYHEFGALKMVIPTSPSPTSDPPRCRCSSRGGCGGMPIANMP